MFKRISNYFNPPKNLNVFNIPVLVKKECRNYSMPLYSDRETWVEYTEAYTDGFYYEKDRVKYFRVKEKDKEPVYIIKTDLVFLTEEENDAGRTVDN
jgi:hypothetical protein